MEAEGSVPALKVGGAIGLANIDWRSSFFDVVKAVGHVLQCAWGEEGKNLRSASAIFL